MNLDDGELSDVLTQLSSAVDIVAGSGVGWTCCKTYVLRIWDQLGFSKSLRHGVSLPRKYATEMYVIGKGLRDRLSDDTSIIVFVAAVVAMSLVEGDALVDPVDVACVHRLARECPNIVCDTLMCSMNSCIVNRYEEQKMYGRLEQWLMLWFEGEYQLADLENRNNVLYELLSVRKGVPLIDWSATLSTTDVARFVLRKYVYGLGYDHRDLNWLPEAVSLARWVAQSLDERVVVVVQACVWVAKGDIENNLFFKDLRGELDALIHLIPEHAVVHAMDSIVQAVQDVNPWELCAPRATFLDSVVGPYTSRPDLMLQWIKCWSRYSFWSIGACSRRTRELECRWSVNRQAWCSAVARCAAHRKQEQGVLGTERRGRRGRRSKRRFGSKI
jgi:hypothetical protein